jgi:hypothetical protein
MQVAPLRYNRTEFVPPIHPVTSHSPLRRRFTSNAGECKVGGGESNVSRRVRPPRSSQSLDTKPGNLGFLN